VVIAVALWAVVVVTLVAQPVVYLVCKNQHHEVVDKIVGICPRINHMKLDEHTRRLFLSPSVRIARFKLFLYFFSTNCWNLPTDQSHEAKQTYVETIFYR
jgi:hypothetical protein